MTDSDDRRIPHLITLQELAALWHVPVTWLHHHTRSGCEDPLPVYRLGRYVRVDPEDQRVTEWLERRKTGGINRAGLRRFVG